MKAAQRYRRAWVAAEDECDALKRALSRVREELRRPGASLGRIQSLVVTALDDTEREPFAVRAERVDRDAAWQEEGIWNPGPDGKYRCSCGERIFAGSAHGCVRAYTGTPPGRTEAEARFGVYGVEGEHEVRCGALFGTVCTCENVPLDPLFRDNVVHRLEALEDGQRIRREKTTEKELRYPLLLSRVDALEKLGRTDGTLGYQHEMKQQRRLDELEANVEALVEWGNELLPVAIQEWAQTFVDAVIEAVQLDEKDLVRFADALNAFGTTVEDVAQREVVSARATLNSKRELRMRLLFQAARKLREDVAPVIDRLDP